jgi:tRNA(Arg) A34 adenosine deaminase TadA
MKSKFFEMAKKLSYKSPSKFKLACVIVKGNSIQSFGWNNMEKTHPKCKTWGNFLHAELHALLGLDHTETKNAVAYVYRETKDGNPANSRPCPVCYEALKISGIKKICYTVDNGYNSEDL